jgi:hypothetical protein
MLCLDLLITDTYELHVYALAGGKTAGGVHGPTLTVLPDALPVGGSITVNLNMTVYDSEVGREMCVRCWLYAHCLSTA